MTRTIRKMFAHVVLGGACLLPLAASADAQQIQPLNAKVPSEAKKTNKALHALLLKSSGWVRFPVATGGTSNGTAWVIDLDRRLMITNDHVVADKDEVFVLFPQTKDGKVVREETAYADLKGVKAVVIDRDRTRDLALIQLESLPAGTVSLPMASEEPEEGDMVRTIGGFTNGGDGLVWGGVGGEVRSVGVNGGLNRVGQVRTVLTTAPTNGGNSGGPLINEAGEVVAVNSYGVERGPGGRQVNGVSGHISVREVKDYMNIVSPLVTPKTASEWTGRGERRLNAGRLDSAVRDFGEAIAKDKKHAQAFYFRGKAFIQKNDPQTGLDDLNQAIALDDAKADYRIARGQAYRDLKNTSEAIADFTAAIRSNPSNAYPYNDRGVTNFRGEKYSEAEEDFTRALSREENVSIFWANRADCKMKRKDFEGAANDYKAAAKLAPWNTTPIIAQSDALLAAGKTQGAVEVLQEAAKRLDHPTLWLQAGLAWFVDGDYKQALPMFTASIKSHGERDSLAQLARAYVGRGICHRETKQLMLAIDDLNKAIELDNKNAHAFLQRGLALQANGGDGNDDFAEAEKLGVKNAAKVKAAANPMIGSWRGIHYLNGAKITHTIHFFADGSFRGSMTGSNRFGQETIEDAGSWKLEGTNLTIRGKQTGTVVRKINHKGEDCDVELSELGTTVVFSRVK